MTAALVENTKLCRGCGKRFPKTTEHFYARGGGRSGLVSECKKCAALRSKNYSKRCQKADPELVKEQGRLRMEKHRRRRGVKPREPIGPTKVCARCNEEKDREIDFYTTMGPSGQPKTSGYCRPCHAEIQRERGWAKRLADQARARHKKKFGEVSDLTPEFIHELWDKQNGLCAWFGVTLRAELGGAYRHPHQVSLDRICNDEGYMQDNVMLVSQAANLARCDTPAEVFADFVRSVKKGIKL